MDIGALQISIGAAVTFMVGLCGMLVHVTRFAARTEQRIVSLEKRQSIIEADIKHEIEKLEDKLDEVGRQVARLLALHELAAAASGAAKQTR